MNVLPTSRERFIEAYESARLVNSRIPSIQFSDGFRFNHPIYLLSLNGEAGCIISQQTGEIASLFGTRKGQGAEVIQTAIAFGGTWLYTWSHLHRLLSHYGKFGFKKWIDVPCWDSSGICMTYMSLEGFESFIRVKKQDGGCESVLV